jgi:hypothetical protein
MHTSQCLVEVLSTSNVLQLEHRGGNYGGYFWVYVLAASKIHGAWEWNRVKYHRQGWYYVLLVGCIMKKGARDRHRCTVDGVVTKFVGKKKAEAKA